MWFTIVFMFRAFNDSLNVWNFWFAENEGDLPDRNFVFEAGNGYGPGGSIRKYLPRSLSVNDYFAIVPVNEPFPIGGPNDEYRSIMDWLLDQGLNTELIKVEPSGFSSFTLKEYLFS